MPSNKVTVKIELRVKPKPISFRDALREQRSIYVILISLFVGTFLYYSYVGGSNNNYVAVASEQNYSTPVPLQERTKVLPALSDNCSQSMLGESCDVSVENVDYQPGFIDVWNLPRVAAVNAPDGILPEISIHLDSASCGGELSIYKTSDQTLVGSEEFLGDGTDLEVRDIENGVKYQIKVELDCSSSTTYSMDITVSVV